MAATMFFARARVGGYLKSDHYRHQWTIPTTDINIDDVREIIKNLERRRIRSILLPKRKVSNTFFHILTQAACAYAKYGFALYFSDNDITDRGIAAVVELLSKNTTITIIDLSYNKIGENGARALLKVFDTNYHILQLHVSNCAIPDELHKQLQEKVLRNQNINEERTRIANGYYATLSEKVREGTGLTQSLSGIISEYLCMIAADEAGEMLPRNYHNPPVLDLSPEQQQQDDHLINRLVSCQSRLSQIQEGNVLHDEEALGVQSERSLLLAGNYADKSKINATTLFKKIECCCML